ncbi:MAG: hypothetical protein WBA57_09310 [Elainellaceae cyanobacterium]
MTELTQEQLIYLLYAKAYSKASEAHTLTKSDVKSHIPDKYKENIEEIYNELKKQKLIELKTKKGQTRDAKGNPLKKGGRFSVTNEGNLALATNLTTTEHDFLPSKSYKVLSTILVCLLPYIKEFAKAHPQVVSSKEMTFDEFQEKFKSLYLAERKNQELSGVVAIHKKEILENFQATYLEMLSSEKLKEYFKELRSKGIVFISKGEKDDLIHWVE